MNPTTEAMAIGVVHRGSDVLATFTVTRLSEEQDLSGGADLKSLGGTVDVIEGMEFGWASSGAHVTVYWLQNRDFVVLASDDSEQLEEAAEIWLGSSGYDFDISVPASIVSQQSLPDALVAGPPLESLPDGYTALLLNPIIFAGSDFADAVTIFDEPIEAMGAALILNDDGLLIATAIGRRGAFEGISTSPATVHESSQSDADDGLYHLVQAEDLEVLLVGADEAARTLADEWQAGL